MKKKLTKILVDKTTYPDGLGKNTPYYVWDTEVIGLILRVYPNGKKAFLIRYRLADTRRRRLLTLGYYPALTITQARQLAQRKLGEIYSGIDPTGIREHAQNELTVAELCDEYIKRYAKPRKKSVSDDESRIRKHIKPNLGPRKLHDVKRADIAALHSKLARKSHYVANRVVCQLSVMFKQAINWGHLSEDHIIPTTRIQAIKEKSRERFLTKAEAARLIRCADEEEDPRIGMLIRLYLLTGARKQEILGLKWEDVDFDGLRLRFPDTKGGKTHWLKPSPEAWAIFESLMKDHRELGNPYVFIEVSPRTNLKDIKKPWERIRENAELPDIRLHDLRKTVASWLAQANVGGPAIQKALGHSQLRMTEVYVQMTAEDTAAPMAKLGEIVGDLQADPRVVPIRSGEK